MPKQVKIAVDIRDLRIAKTGARTYLEELIREFKKTKDPHVKFYFFDTIFPVYTESNPIFKIIEHLRYFFWKQIQLPIKAALNCCDIVFCTDYFVPYFHLGFKTVPVFHDAFFFEYPEHYNKYWLYLFKTVGIAAAKKSLAVVTPTQYTQKRIAKLSGIATAQIKVIYEGPKSDLTAQLTKETTPIKKLGKYLLHVGTMEKRKNIVRLLEAFKLVLVQHPEFKLVLVGQFSPKTSMDDRNEILDFITQNGLQKQVVLAGYVSDAELINYYKNAHAYVFPSLNEGFGIPILEAFRAKIPVLVANNSCLPEVGGDAVRQFDPYNYQDIAEQINTVIADENIRMEMVKKGSERLEQFNWENAAQQLLNLFKNKTS